MPETPKAKHKIVLPLTFLVEMGRIYVNQVTGLTTIAEVDLLEDGEEMNMNLQDNWEVQYTVEMPTVGSAAYKAVEGMRLRQIEPDL